MSLKPKEMMKAINDEKFRNKVLKKYNISKEKFEEELNEFYAYSMPSIAACV